MMNHDGCTCVMLGRLARIRAGLVVAQRPAAGNPSRVGAIALVMGSFARTSSGAGHDTPAGRLIILSLAARAMYTGARTDLAATDQLVKHGAIPCHANSCMWRGL